MPDQVDQRAMLQGAVVRELAIGYQLLATRLNRELRSLGLTLTSVSLLSHLAWSTKAQSVGEIAAAMEVNQPAVSKTLRSLVDRDAVKMEAAATDSRRHEVTITAEGVSLLHRAHGAMHPQATAAFAEMPDASLLALSDTLQQLCRNLEES